MVTCVFGFYRMKVMALLTISVKQNTVPAGIYIILHGYSHHFFMEYGQQMNLCLKFSHLIWPGYRAQRN